MAKTTSAMETIRRLVALAEDPAATDAERQAALKQANRLMVRHAIDEATIRSHQTAAERSAPVREEWTWLSRWTEYHPYLRSMLDAIARANRVKVVIDLRPPYHVTVIGMKDDADWVQMLYTNCYLAFVGRLLPEWDNELGIDENAYRLKVAGKTWGEIWYLMATVGFGMDENDFYWHHANQGRYHWRGIATGVRNGVLNPLPCTPQSPSVKYLLRAYRRHAKLIGDTNPVETQRHDAYRRSFAKGFAQEIERRLDVMRREADVEVAASGQEVALRDSFEDVLDEYYRQFPDHHPDKVRADSMVAAEKNREYWRKEREAREAMLAAMTERQRAIFLEKEERKAARNRKSNNRYWEQREARDAADHSGTRLGRDAARSVSLTRGTPVKAETSRPGLGS